MMSKKAGTVFFFSTFVSKKTWFIQFSKSIGIV